MKFSLKFLPLKDLFYSIFPTVGTYGGYIQGVAPSFFPNLWIAIGIGLIVSVILAIIFYNENVKAYKKSLAEILATGYFMNFTGRFGKLLKTKTPIHFSFPDDTIRSFTADKITIEVGMPSSLKSLTEYAEMVENKFDIVYVREATYSEPFWLRAQLEGDDRLVIHEFPRTLFSLSKYLKDDFIDQQMAEKNSKKIYSVFQHKIEQLRIEYSNEISNDRLIFRPVQGLGNEV
tara:strand:- start:81 stop:776 length:696 start_codon:yes stop_codon:yes gene_type:complete